MKITLCGSVKFADKLVEIYHELEKLGHEPLMHKDMFGIADGTAQELIDGIKMNHAEIKRKHNFIKWWHDCIKSGDAILVCNYNKSGIKIISEETRSWKSDLRMLIIKKYFY